MGSSTAPRDGKMRVLIIDHTAGVAPFRRKFEAIAAYDDVELTVLAPAVWHENYRPVSPPETGRGYDIRTGRVAFSGYNNRSFFLTGLAGALISVRPHILDIYEEAYSFFLAQATALARLLAPEAKLIFHSSDSLSHGGWYPYRPCWIYAAIQRHAHRVGKYAFTINETAGEILRSKGFAGPITRVFHGINEEEFRPMDKAPLRSELGLSGTVIGYVGKLSHKKGIDVLIRAVAGLGGEVTLLILGDGDERGHLEQLAVEASIRERTRFVAGVPHEQVPRYLNALDVLVLPTVRSTKCNETFGRVLVEAMACGVPVIGTTCGSMRLVVGDDGLIVQDGDVEALRRQLEALLSDPELMRDLGERGRRRVLELYTWPRFAARIHQGYVEVLKD